MNVYDGIMYANWLLLLFFVALVTWNLFEAQGLARKLQAAAILVPFVVRLLWIA
ncbi:MAG: hypothetical protein QN176_14265 [Armatimonadota bacterium]|nr:hypothetical protein [Armatimonadota bacterium]